MVGDAAGLVRPFKGKGVNSALLTGTWAAHALLAAGISSHALRQYRGACREITGDLPYARGMRALAIALSKSGFLNVIIKLAERDARLRRALFDWCPPTDRTARS